MKISILVTLLLLSTLVHAQQTHPCSADAIKQAKALLIFHAGTDVNVSVDEAFKVLAPLRNPVNRRQYLTYWKCRAMSTARIIRCV